MLRYTKAAPYNGVLWKRTESFLSASFIAASGSDLTYDDSMNLRNILWLAPLPTNSSEAWSAPGILQVLVFKMLFLSITEI